MTTFAKDQLKSIIERVEKLEEEKKATADDIRDVYAEAKGNGYDVTALRTIVRMRKMDVDTRREQQDILDTYMNALGMLGGTPLGDAAVRREFGDDDTKVTIRTGQSQVKTTIGGMKRAADAMNKRSRAAAR